MEIRIRRASVADAERIAEHNEAMARETENLELDRQRLRRGVEAALNDPTKGFYTVAVADGQAVGQMMVTFEWSDWRNATFWWLQSVYVQPEYRRRGIYRRLYEQVLDEAKSRQDICGVRLYVSKENVAAQRVYGRLGLKKANYEMCEVDFVLRRKRPQRHRDTEKKNSEVRSQESEEKQVPRSLRLRPRLRSG